ncbi:TRAP transporter large permease subunit [Comamonas sp. CMM02]|nr:TRAP transporter large permease subunit [Comamonas sp. CMM02]
MMKQEMPILAPISAVLGIDPLHFAMIVIVNLTMAMVPLPVGGLLFVTGVATRTPIAALTRELPIFIVAQLLMLMLMLMILTFVPALSTSLPHAFGFNSQRLRIKKARKFRAFLFSQ